MLDMQCAILDIGRIIIIIYWSHNVWRYVYVCVCVCVRAYVFLSIIPGSQFNNTLACLPPRPVYHCHCHHKVSLFVPRKTVAFSYLYTNKIMMVTTDGRCLPSGKAIAVQSDVITYFNRLLTTCWQDALQNSICRRNNAITGHLYHLP